MTVLVPRRFWYSSVVRLSWLQGWLSSFESGGEARWKAATALEWWLAELTLRGGFPVRYKVEGLEIWAMAREHPGGVLLCGVHMPYMRLAMRALMEHGVRASFIVTAREHVAPDGWWMPTGCTKGLHPVLQGPMALMQMRGRLRDGEIGALMMDRDPNGPLYPNGMQLAGRMGALVVLAWTEMFDGVVTVTYQVAPHPIPYTEEKVKENLAVLNEQRTRILEALDYRAPSPAEVGLGASPELVRV
jgi:hypothetical protein